MVSSKRKSTSAARARRPAKTAASIERAQVKRAYREQRELNRLSRKLWAAIQAGDTYLHGLAVQLAERFDLPHATRAAARERTATAARRVRPSSASSTGAAAAERIDDAAANAVVDHREPAPEEAYERV